MENETLKERFLGTFFGQAVGDALGAEHRVYVQAGGGSVYPNGIGDYSQIVQDAHLL